MTTPKENRSLRKSMRSPMVCSGDMYDGVPSPTPDKVISPKDSSRAMPKSMSFTSPRLDNMMFAGFDVPVNHPTVVGVVHGPGDAQADDQGHVHRQRAFLFEQVVEIDALHVLQHHEAVLAFTDEVVDVDDVLVLQRGDGLRFALETHRHLFLVGVLTLELLDGDFPAEALLVGPARP